MANLRYVSKDPSFKYFIIGLVLFVVIAGGGIFVVKKMLGDRNQQVAKPQTSQPATDGQNKKSEDVVVIDGDNKKDSLTEAEPANTVEQPKEIAATGPADLPLQILAVGGLGYATGLFIRSKRT